MNAYEAILEALIARERSGEGAELSVSMFDAMADWMAVPLMQQEARQAAAACRARAHLDRALRRVSDAATASRFSLLSRTIANGGCWRRRSWATPRSRPIRPLPPTSSACKRRAETDGKVAAIFGTLDAER